MSTLYGPENSILQAGGMHMVNPYAINPPKISERLDGVRIQMQKFADTMKAETKFNLKNKKRRENPEESSL